MNRIVALLATCAVLCMSCRKEYTCDCVHRGTGETRVATFTATKEDAKAACDGSSKQSDNYFTCKLR